VADTGDLLVVERAPGLQAQHDGGRRALVLRAQQAALGHGHVHPGVVDLLHVADGARQLPFDGALQVDPLRELRHAKVALVEELEAHAASARQPLGGEQQTRVVHLARGHRDGIARCLHAKGDARGAQGVGAGGAVVGGEVGKDHLVVARLGPTEDQGDHTAKRQERRAHDGGEACAPRHRQGAVLQLVHFLHRVHGSSLSPASAGLTPACA
jgi:hypothetical protein